MPLRNRTHLLAAILCVVTAVLLVAAFLRPKYAAGSAYSAYLGSGACAGCHAVEFQQHRMSRHATTLRNVDRASLGPDVPVPGDIADTNFQLKAAGTGFALAVKNEPEMEQPLQLALGSGKFALTYIHIMDKDSVVELRESYYPASHSWQYTPGQAHIDGDGLGRMYSGTLARACVTCHTTALAADTLTPEPRFYGVGCESCHGPGRDHAAAMRAGKTTDLHMARLEQQGATHLNEMCGRCHRTAKNVPPGSTSTQRFQPYGLMKSRCYKESGDRLSCQTCHNPHSNASTDAKVYERTCLSCHAPAAVAAGPAQARGKPCPVNRLGGCLPCHMPRREVTPDAPISMADHFIRVHRPRSEQDSSDSEFNPIGPTAQ